MKAFGKGVTVKLNLSYFGGEMCIPKILENVLKSENNILTVKDSDDSIMA